MTRKASKTPGQKKTRGKTNGAAPYCGKPEVSPADMQALRKVEAFILMRCGLFRHRTVPKRPNCEPNDRHKRVDFFGRVRMLIDMTGDVRSVAPDDNPDDHRYTAADPFSDLNPQFADFVAEAMGVSDHEDTDDDHDKDERIDDDEVVEIDESNPYANFYFDSDGHIPLPAHSGVAYSIEASRKRTKNLHLWERHL